ncbi:MAG: Branched-chain-amino-acid aminotransferase [Anaerolineae bacterium]|nr:Branched-chain-amino-acid aminotransferase [Anaerolineae bacterium]
MAEATIFPTVWWDGKLMPYENATINVTQIGTASVSSVFEGIRAYMNPQTGELAIFQLDAHLKRFLQSIRLVRLECACTLQDLHDAALALLRANQPATDVYLRPFAYAESRTFGSATSTRAQVILHVAAWESKLQSGAVSHAAVSSWTRLSDNQMAPRVKASANYLNSRYAAEEAKRNGYDHALLLTPQGKVAEGPGMCLMLARDGKLITPSVTSDILESITRETVMQIAREKLNLAVVERAVDRTELYTSAEAFFCGTGIEIVPIVSVDRLALGDGKPGVITQRVQTAYHDIVRGIDASYPEWRTVVGAAA